MTELARDAEKISNEAGEMNVVMWFPDEFWKASAAANPNSKPAQLDRFLKVVHLYYIAGVGSAKVGPFAAFTFRTEAEIRGILQLKDNEGNIYKPLPEDKMDVSMPALLGLMKQVLVWMMGPLGENLHFYLFSGSNKEGARICDPQKEGACEVGVGKQVFKWRLPLGSPLPKQTCPVCGETLSGAYKFCPYDGTKQAGSK